MNLEEARKRARGYSVSTKSEDFLVAKLSRDVLELADEVEKLRERAEYWEAAHQTDMKIMTEQLHHAILKGG